MITGPDLRKARTDKGVGLGTLAAMIGRTKGHLSMVERGVGDRAVTYALIRDYQRALGVVIPSAAVDDHRADSPGDPPAGVAETPGETVTRPATSFPDNVEAMRRRGLFGAVMATALGASPAGSLILTTKQPGRVGPSDVARLRATAARLYALDYQHGGESLWQTALLSAGHGYSLLEQGTYVDDIGLKLMRATGRMEMCAGWLASDAGRHDVARSCYNEALALARQAGDPEIETHALANLAFLSNALGQPRAAQRFAVAAVRVAQTPGCSPRLSVIPHLRRSLAAAIDDDAKGSDRAIRDARILLDTRVDPSGDEESTSFVSQAEIDGIEGTCAIWLHKPDRATILLERAIRGHTDRFVRTRALYNVRLARARVDAGAIDGAVEAANAALDDLAGEVASWRVSNEFGAIAARIAEHPRISGVDLVLARYSTLMRPERHSRDSEEQS